jgi:hypothetical protein
MSRRTMMRFDAPLSPMPAPVTSRGSSSLPSSPLVVVSQDASLFCDAQFFCTSPVGYTHAGVEAHRVSFQDGYLGNRPYVSSVPRPSWSRRPMRSYPVIDSIVSFPPASPLSPGLHTLSPRGYWQKPPMSPQRPWSPAAAVASPPRSWSPAAAVASPQSQYSNPSVPARSRHDRRIHGFSNGDLAVPVLHRSNSSHAVPVSPPRALTQRHVSAPASPLDFCPPPTSPRSDSGRRETQERVIEASSLSNEFEKKIRRHVSAGTNGFDQSSPSREYESNRHHDAAGIHETNYWEFEMNRHRDESRIPWPVESSTRAFESSSSRLQEPPRAHRSPVVVVSTDNFYGAKNEYIEAILHEKSPCEHASVEGDKIVEVSRESDPNDSAEETSSIGSPLPFDDEETAGTMMMMEICDLFQQPMNVGQDELFS